VIHNFFLITKSFNSLDCITVVPNKHYYFVNAPLYVSQYFVGFNFCDFVLYFCFEVEEISCVLLTVHHSISVQCFADRAS
jgi:hypothetical protein